jgi:hypothetical protein
MRPGLGGAACSKRDIVSIRKMSHLLKGVPDRDSGIGG